MNIDIHIYNVCNIFRCSYMYATYTCMYEQMNSNTLFYLQVEERHSILKWLNSHLRSRCRIISKNLVQKAESLFICVLMSKSSQLIFSVLKVDLLQRKLKYSSVKRQKIILELLCFKMSVMDDDNFSFVVLCNRNRIHLKNQKTLQWIQSTFLPVVVFQVFQVQL